MTVEHLIELAKSKTDKIDYSRFNSEKLFEVAYNCIGLIESYIAKKRDEKDEVRIKEIMKNGASTQWLTIQNNDEMAFRIFSSIISSNKNVSKIEIKAVHKNEEYMLGTLDIV